MVYIPGYPHRFPSAVDMCTPMAMHPQNLQCICVGPVLMCGSTRERRLQKMINWCYKYCQCGPNTRIRKDVSTTDLDQPRSEPHAPNPQTLPSGNIPTGNTHTCSGICTSVVRGCVGTSNGDCKCFAPPVSLFYWHQGDCGTRLPFKAKRDLVQQRHSYYLNATARFASNAPPGPPLDLAAQLASDLLPSPCNASYVSFACADSIDGIVHEPPQNWLGALLPEGAKAPPPVPDEFLRIHGGDERLSQVVVK